jgi:hypothetical protein
LSKQLGRLATLDDVTDAELYRIAKLGFDWVVVPAHLADRSAWVGYNLGGGEKLAWEFTPLLRRRLRSPPLNRCISIVVHSLEAT